MKLEKWAMIAEVISGFAILITLVILVMDVRSNSRLLQREQYMERVDREYFLNSEDLVGIVAKMATAEPASRSTHLREFMDRYDLTLLEAQQWSSYAWRTWKSHEADYLYGDIGILENVVRSALDDPGLVLYLELRPTLFDENFVEYVNNLKTAGG